MPTLTIIAEIAQGFEGKPAHAVALLAAGAAAGADAVKFQLVYAEELAAPDYAHFKLFQGLEMPDAVWSDLAELAREKGTALHLDIFGPRSLGLAERIGAGAVKIHSTDMANVGFIRNVAQSSIGEVLLSCGGCHRDEIARAVEALGDKRLVLLHGFQGYPTPVRANQIARLAELARLTLGRSARIGFADHAPESDPLRFLLAAAAIGAGATVLEKHLTLAGVLKLEDHESAMNPDEFALFATQARACAEAIGVSASSTPDFGMSPEEAEYRKKVRKHVVALRDLPAGSVLAPTELGLKRTSSVGACDDLALVYGRRLKVAVRRDQAISRELLEEAK
jgi:N,N'-diacetyllegionaminate synthase